MLIKQALCIWILIKLWAMLIAPNTYHKISYYELCSYIIYSHAMIYSHTMNYTHSMIKTHYVLQAHHWTMYVICSGTNTEFHFLDPRSQLPLRTKFRTFIAKSGPILELFRTLRPLKAKIRTFSGPWLHLSLDPDQVRDSGPYQSHLTWLIIIHHSKKW